MAKPFSVYHWFDTGGVMPSGWTLWKRYSKQAAADEAIGKLRKNVMYNGADDADDFRASSDTDKYWCVRRTDEGPPTEPPE